MEKKKAPKPRRSWKINPKTRVKPSDKTYERPAEKKKTKKNLADQIHWFGE